MLIGRVRDIGQEVYNLIFKQEVVAAPVTSTSSSLSGSSTRPVLEI